MSIKVVRKRGKDYIVIDTRPSRKIRRAKARAERRQRKLLRHFKRRRREEE